MNPRRRGLTIVHSVLAVLVIGLIVISVLALLPGITTWLLLLTQFVLLSSSLFQLYVIRGYVTLTPEGIVVREVRRRLLPWREIVELRTKPFLANTVVQVRLANGRKRNLIAPVRLRAKDASRFYEGAGLIHHWWLYYRGW